MVTMSQRAVHRLICHRHQGLAGDSTQLQCDGEGETDQGTFYPVHNVASHRVVVGTASRYRLEDRASSHTHEGPPAEISLQGYKRHAIITELKILDS